ncbi:MAG: zf-HC2 domain-containing protein [Anaerolineae bacterium]
MASRNARQGAEHRFSQANLSAYIDKQLHPRERARVARHLEECPACRRELAELRRTIALVSQAPRMHALRSFALPQTMQPAQARQRRWESLFAFARTAAVVASVLMVILFAGDMALSFVWQPELRAGSAEPTATIVATRLVEYSEESEPAAILESAAAPEEPAPEMEAEAEQAVAAVAESVKEAAPTEEASENVAMRTLPTTDARTPTSTEGMGGGAEVASVASTGEMPIKEERAWEALPTTSVAADTAPTALLETPTATPVASAIPPTEEPTMAPPTPSPTGMPSATPEELAIAAPAEAPTEAPSAGQPPLEHAPYWQVWGWLRTLWILTGGLLLILLGLLVWSGYRKRV